MRERMEDLPELLGHFIAKYNKKMGVRARFDDRVIESLQQYAFPGNVRELEHMVEQAVALVQDGVIHPEDLLPHANAPQAPPRRRSTRPSAGRSKRPCGTPMATASARPSSWASRPPPCGAR
jgi:DNA-binding NtrC family response regulator